LAFGSIPYTVIGNNGPRQSMRTAMPPATAGARGAPLAPEARRTGDRHAPDTSNRPRQRGDARRRLAAARGRAGGADWFTLSTNVRKLLAQPMCAGVKCMASSVHAIFPQIALWLPRLT
jgi:hypothetical protein